MNTQVVGEEEAGRKMRDKCFEWVGGEVCVAS